jgi:hypothetical protein
MYYGYIQDIWELDYGVRMRIPIFRCQWVKHPNSMNVDNYGLTLVDLKNVGHQDGSWVLADRVAQVFYVLDPETRKYIVVSGKQKIVGVENVEDNDEDVNQFEEMCHTPFREIGNEASIRVPRMFKSHAWQQYDKQMQCY